MARPQTDPLELCIADGRIRPWPETHYGLPTILDLNLEQLHANIFTNMAAAYTYYLPIRNQYAGADDDDIRDDLDALATFAVASCYNRLRAVLRHYPPVAMTQRMNLLCPVSNRIEMPTYLASTLGSIGPLRVTDGPVDMMLVYATPAAQMQTFGRDEAPKFNEGRLFRITQAFRNAGVGLSRIDCDDETTGHYFTTTLTKVQENLFTVKGVIHSSHYENEDIARAFLTMSKTDGTQPFQPIPFIVGYCNDFAVVAAVAAASSDGVNTAATAAGRAIAGHYVVNQHGIRPAIGAEGTASHVPAGVYIIGRGNQPIGVTILAHNLIAWEAWEFLFYRLTSP